MTSQWAGTMSELRLSNKPQNRVRFREDQFFDYLRRQGSSRLLGLLREIDARAAIEISKYIIRYLQPWEEKPVQDLRRRRGRIVVKKMSTAVKRLQQAADAYRALEGLEVTGAFPSDVNVARLFPQSRPFTAEIMEEQVNRLSALLESRKPVYNEKRLGVTANHLWLVLLKEFVSAWTELEHGKSVVLNSVEIALLITAGKSTLGWRENKTETDAEGIRKAIWNFRRNPANAHLCQQAQNYALGRCQRVKNGLSVPGIKI